MRHPRRPSHWFFLPYHAILYKYLRPNPGVSREEKLTFTGHKPAPHPRPPQLEKQSRRLPRSFTRLPLHPIRSPHHLSLLGFRSFLDHSLKLLSIEAGSWELAFWSVIISFLSASRFVVRALECSVATFLFDLLIQVGFFSLSFLGFLDLVYYIDYDCSATFQVCHSTLTPLLFDFFM